MNYFQVIDEDCYMGIFHTSLSEEAFKAHLEEYLSTLDSKDDYNSLDLIEILEKHDPKASWIDIVDVNI